MTTTRLLGVLLVVMAMTVAMARSRQIGSDSTPREFAVVGVVTAAPADGRVMVAHEAIGDYMPAMTMPFALRSGESAPALAPGDKVRFTLRVDGNASHATAFERVGRDEAVAAALRGDAPTAASRLRKGDPVPEVSLVTQDGAPFTIRDLQGRITAVTFIFTRCPMPEFCPLMVRRFQEVQRTIAADQLLADARLVAVTLDPTFDTPQVLASYARAMQADPARWQFVTGSPSEIQRLTKAFSIHVERNGVLLDHTLATAVVGPDGRVRELWRGNGWTANEVVTALRVAATPTAGTE